jgi:hypothetical protein
VLVTCNPVYQSLHNQPMTESISGSMYVLGLAAALDILLHRPKAMFPFAVLAGSGIITSQLRSQGVIFFVIFGTVVMLAGKNGAHRLRGFICLVCVFASVLIWPVYRYAVTGHAFLPNGEYLLLCLSVQPASEPRRDSTSRDDPASHRMVRREPRAARGEYEGLGRDRNESTSTRHDGSRG